MLMNFPGNIAVPASAQANAQFIGVSETDNPIVSLGYTLPWVNCLREGTFRFFSTSGDNYNPWDVVYIGAGSQTVTKVSTGSTPVGFVDPEQFAKQMAAVGGAPVRRPRRSPRSGRERGPDRRHD